jgi:two-component system, NarL family, nitrate/nitrite response regulator NarL
LKSNGFFDTLALSGKGSRMSDKIRVAILDDHQSIVDGYRFRLANSHRVWVVAAIHYGDELEPSLENEPADVLLLDVGVPTSSNNPNPYPILHVIPSLLQRYPSLVILVISMHVERGLIRAVMEAGASGYILKEDQATLRDLENVIISVHNGGIYLSRRANDILLRGVDGNESLLSKRQLEALSLCLAFPDSTTAELAKRMSISNSTIRNLLSGAYLKLGVRTRTAAVTRARQLGLISPEAANYQL